MSYERLNADNAAMLLSDHQVGTMGWMHSGPTEVMRRNAEALAKAAKITGMPVVLTSSQEDQVQGHFHEFEVLILVLSSYRTVFTLGIIWHNLIDNHFIYIDALNF